MIIIYDVSTVLNDNANTAFNSSLMLDASYHQADTAKAHFVKTHTKQWKSLKINNLRKECDTKGTWISLLCYSYSLRNPSKRGVTPGVIRKFLQVGLPLEIITSCYQ